MTVLLGLLAAIGTTTGIVLDMDWLRINRAGLSRIGWCLASVVTGPFAAVAYLACRHFARRRLISAVWKMVGNRASLLACVARVCWLCVNTT